MGATSIGTLDRSYRAATFVDPFSSSLEMSEAPSVVDLLTRLEQSEVVDPQVLYEVKAKLSTQTTDSRSVVKDLIRQGILTPFQGTALLSDTPPALVLGNYVLLEKLGHGGMGVVFHAWHRRLKRPVALKTLPDAELGTPDHVARFRREAEAAGRLEHPNIVATYDADEANGVHFLAMQYIDGVTLDELVARRGPLAPGDAINLILQTARGLAFAHAHGVVHRDIKPSNLILGVDGTLRILDMGLARTAAAKGDADPPDALAMGSADFLAPEQGRLDAPTDPRSDIYSLGCTLFYLLTGRTVYARGSMLRRILAHREQPIPSLRHHRGEVSPALDAVFHKMLAKAPEDRYQTAAELIDALEQCGPSGLQSLITSGVIRQSEIASRGLGNEDLEEMTAPLPLPLLQNGDLPAAKRRSRRSLLAGVLIVSAALGLVASAMVPWSATASRPLQDGHAAGTDTDSTDRRAALWALDAGGTIQINLDGVWQAVNRADELPPGTLRLVSVQLGGNTNIRDSDLANLRGAAGLQMLWLGGAAISDEGLAYLAELEELRYLSLAETAVTDAGLSLLSRLQNLRTLRLLGTQISDGGIPALLPLRELEFLSLRDTRVSDAAVDLLSQLPNLAELDLRATLVTADGAQRLQKAIPGCEVRH